MISNRPSRENFHFTVLVGCAVLEAISGLFCFLFGWEEALGQKRDRWLMISLLAFTCSGILLVIAYAKYYRDDSQDPV